jgi:hypothetical protein
LVENPLDRPLAAEAGHAGRSRQLDVDADLIEDDLDWLDLLGVGRGHLDVAGGGLGGHRTYFERWPM